VKPLPVPLLRKCWACGAWHVPPASYTSRCTICHAQPLRAIPAGEFVATDFEAAIHCTTCGLVLIKPDPDRVHCPCGSLTDLTPLQKEIVEWLSEVHSANVLSQP